MSENERHFARADHEAAKRLANTESPFTIEVEFLDGLTDPQKNAFKQAADRWVKVIVGDLPDIALDDGRIVDDLLIQAEGKPIDGVGIVLGQAGPTGLRPNPGPTEFIPATGLMSFDTADLASMEANGTLVDVITHEMGHVLGIGTIWDLKHLLRGAGTSNPTFIGRAAMAEYARLVGTSAPRRVPVENTGDPGTRDAHWRESVFANELMTGFVGRAGNPLSRLTVASLADLGYQVDLDAADPYTLPNHLELAESGVLRARIAPIDVGVMRPTSPEILPAGSLQAA
ncbi:leishmanolysin-related zinc metalloendopeptidase [Kitasatospora sp. NPDC001527]|uniref:leishmanolysin-related zinc metalloendopeptidase n=1 Tax=Kitasatospora sp. NPDC001527 TaxID=3154519 RepID=UPI00331D14F7